MTSCPNCGSAAEAEQTPSTDEFAKLQRQLRRQDSQDGSTPGYEPGDVVLERYELMGVLGGGPTGTVFKAFDQEVEVEVAFKAIAPPLLPTEPTRKNFLLWIRRLRDIVHGNVVRYFDVDQDGERCFYVTQFLEGLSLRKIIDLRQEKRQRFTPAEIAPICAQLCRALGDCHDVVHGGLKPDNIIVLPDVLKVTDFALPTALPLDKYLAAHDDASGAARYIAPELRAGRVFDYRADVFSIGAIACEMLTGAPFVGDTAPLRALCKELSPRLVEILERTLSEDPAGRHNDPEELGVALGEVLAAQQSSRRLTLPYGQQGPTSVPPDNGRAAGVHDRATVRTADPGDGAAVGELGDDRPTVPVDREALADARAQAARMGQDVPTNRFERTEVRPLVVPAAESAPEPESESESEPELTPTADRSAGADSSGTQPAVREHSQRTHQLSVDEVEFAEDSARTALDFDGAPTSPQSSSTDAEPDRPGEDLLDETPAPEQTAPGAPSQSTQKLSLDELEEIDEEEASESESGLARTDDDVTQPRAHLESDPLPDLGSEQPESLFGKQDTAPVEQRASALAPAAAEQLPTLPDDALSGVTISGETETIDEPDIEAAPEPSGRYPLATDERVARQEVRAREALQAFGGPPETQDSGAFDAAGIVNGAGSAPAPLGTPSEAGAQQRATGPQMEVPVAAEVLHDDAVPQPLGAGDDPSIRLPRRNLTFPLMLVALMLVGGTVGAIVFMQKQRGDQARAELEQKRARLRKLVRPAAIPIGAGSTTDEPDAGTVAALQRPDATAATEPGEPAEPLARPPEPPAPRQATPRPAARPRPAAPTRAPAPAPKAPAAVTPPPEAPPAVTPPPKAPAAVTPPPKAPPATPTSASGCYRGMVRVGSSDGESFCIDRYEAPGKGRVPRRGVSLSAARAACRARGVRLCTGKEWRRACGGVFPYGAQYESGRCQTGAAAPAAAGSKSGCRSRWGVYDQSGNVSEWVEEGAALGGDAGKAANGASCAARGAGGPMTGYRCCSDLDDWD